MVKMNAQKVTREDTGANAIPEIDVLGQDLLQKILSRLPAKSFAWAACVCRCWNSICDRVLSFPKLSSAISFDPSLEGAVDEIVDEVLSEPIRPHFALITFAPYLPLEAAHELITEKLGSRIPTVTVVSQGVIGRDMYTDEIKEVQWAVIEELYTGEGSPPGSANRGFLLTVGFLPGLKVHIIPLLVNLEAPRRLLIDEFVMNIRDYSLSVSGSASPDAIMLFADHDENINPVLQIMEYAFSSSTVIVGDMGCQFLYKCDSRNSTTGGQRPHSAAVALVFAKDKNKPVGIGETQFELAISKGMLPIGSPYKTVSVKRNESSTMLTATKVRHHDHLDGLAIVADIYDEAQLGELPKLPVLYIGVTKRRRCSVGTEKVRWMQFLEFHEVTEANEEYLIVNSVGIKTRDPFRFYIADCNVALSSCREVYNNLKCLKEGCSKGKVVFGGILFACCGRGTSFFEEPVLDSCPFWENFPDVTFAGSFCSGEIARGDSSLYKTDDEEFAVARSCQHIFSAVNLVMSYTPPQN